jgi:flagellar biosynthetic protein FliS
MNPYAAYQQKAKVASTRIDLLLALYDGAIERIGQARAALQQGDRLQAWSRVAWTQLIVAEIANGIRLDANPEIGANILRLTEYVAHQLTHPDEENLTAAQNVLTTLRDGFAAIRAEAIQLERAGQIPPVDAVQTISSLA